MIPTFEAVSYLLNLLPTRDLQLSPEVSKAERNKVIRARWLAGEPQAQLAREYSISYQRVHQIVHHKRK